MVDLPSGRRRHVDGNPRALTRRRDDLEVAADRLRPLSHRLETKPRPSGSVELQRVEAVAVVDDLDSDLLSVRPDDDLDVRRFGVLANVAERLLHDANELDLSNRGERNPVGIV